MGRVSVVAAALAVALAIAACEMPTGEGTIVGSPSDRPIAGLVFRLDTT